MYVLKLYIYNMHMYVYYSYNEFQNEYLNFEFFYSNLKIMSTLKIVILILKKE